MTDLFSGAACQNRTDDLFITSDRSVPGNLPQAIKTVDFTGLFDFR